MLKRLELYSEMAQAFSEFKDFYEQKDTKDKADLWKERVQLNCYLLSIAAARVTLVEEGILVSTENFAVNSAGKEAYDFFYHLFGTDSMKIKLMKAVESYSDLLTIKGIDLSSRVMVAEALNINIDTLCRFMTSEYIGALQSKLKEAMRNEKDPQLNKILDAINIKLASNAASMYKHDVFPQTRELLVKALSEARECSNPVAAKLNLGPGFRYGCFCGANYPNINHPSGKDYKTLSLMEREELVEAYYKIKPIDDIDKACRDHDVCYIRRGREDEKCNITLREDLLKIIKSMKQMNLLAPDVGSLEWRCSNLAADMNTAFLTIFSPGKTGSESLDLAVTGMKTLTTVPLVGCLALFRPPVWLDNPYPLPGERCSLKTPAKGK